MIDRWPASRKLGIITEVREGRISLAEAIAKYGISGDEFTEWLTALENSSDSMG